MTSEIRANTLKNRVGLGTVSFTNTGPVVSGIVTANSFSGPFTGDITGDGDLTLTSTDSGAAAAPTLRLQRDSSSPANGDILGQIMFGGKDSTPNDENYASVAGKIIQAGAGGEHGAIQITTRKNSAHVITANLTSTDYELLNGTNLSVDGDITGNGNFQLTSTDTGSSAAPELTLLRNSTSPADADYLGQIKFAGKHDGGSTVNYAKITGKILDASNGTEDGIIEFAHIKAGSQNISARFRSDSLQLLNGTALTVAGSTTVTGNIIPSSDSATDIGTNSVRFANIYADTLYGDGSNLTGITQTTISNNSDNRLITGTGTANTINAEADLTFDGTSLKLTDHKNMYFGTGNDLRIWHDANNSYSQISGGQKNLYIDGLTTYMRSGDGGGSGVENAIVMNNNSSVDVYHSGARKFKSHSNGLSVKNEAGGTSTSLYVIGSEGESAEIQMNADDGDDNADYWRLINFASDNTWRVQNYSSGGWGSSIVAKTNGYVGINESNAQQQLHVHDDNNYKGILVNGNGAPRIGFARNTTTTGEWSVGIDGTNGNQFVINNSNDNSNRKLILSSSGVSVAGTLTTGGACTINGNLTATGFVDSSSDIKLKTNIKTIDNALDKVLQLRGTEYDRIDRDNQHEIGVIAQEVEKIIPEVVHGDETKTVSYGNMVAVLIEAIKEQNEVINEMKKEIDELKSS